jgi:signal recognition particle receptor subunit beta
MYNPTEYKILFTGHMGAGKTTAIAAISDIAPVRTEAVNTTRGIAGKLFTTVGLDYGEITLETGEHIRLYGTPGQSRFASLWTILARGALGAVILLNHSLPDATDRLDEFLKAFRGLIEEAGAVVGVTHSDMAPHISFEPYYRILEKRRMVLPVIPLDARNRHDVVGAIDALLRLVEANWDEAERGEIEAK